MSYLLSWGANSRGQLGQGAANEQVEEPRNCTPESSFSWEGAQAGCGGGHTIILDGAGALWSCGWNHRRQLGFDGVDLSSFRRLWNLSGIKFTAVAGGWDFSCAVTCDMFLFVWGSNSHGQLGLLREHFPKNVKPVRLQLQVTSVACGMRHTVVVSTQGEAWSTGCGKHGQLGHGESVIRLDRFTRVKGALGLSQVACGERHTIAWSEREAALYVWGDNAHGQLLLDSNRYPRLHMPHKIDIDVRCGVKRLLSGWSFAALCTCAGELLAWGRNTYGQLGGETRDPRGLTRVVLPGQREVEDFALGSEHGVCVARDGSVWAWGWNEHGNTGTAPGEQLACVRTPTAVPTPTLSTPIAVPTPIVSTPTAVPTPTVSTPTAVPLAAGALPRAVFAGGAHNLLVCWR